MSRRMALDDRPFGGSSSLIHGNSCDYLAVRAGCGSSTKLFAPTGATVPTPGPLRSGRWVWPVVARSEGPRKGLSPCACDCW